MDDAREVKPNYAKANRIRPSDFPYDQAQRYPADYDGIVSIDPVMNWSGLQTFGNVHPVRMKAPHASRTRRLPS